MSKTYSIHIIPPILTHLSFVTKPDQSARYQRRRMYTRIALGKNSAMDVVSGEASGSRGQLLLLYPLLFGEQGSAAAPARPLRRLPTTPRSGLLQAANARAPHRRLRAPGPPLPHPLPSRVCNTVSPRAAVMQAWQCVVGVHVAVRTWPALLASEGWLDLERCQSDLRGMRGTFLCGCIYAALAIMNFVNTVATITDKASTNKARRKSVGGGNGGGGVGGAAAAPEGAAGGGARAKAA